MLLHAKLHRAHITHANREYEGSFSIDTELLQKSGILENEQIQIYNISNGQRFITYAIAAPFGSKIIGANGACAHLVKIGDAVIICAYAQFSEKELTSFKPRILFLDVKNDYIYKEEYNQHPLCEVIKIE